MASRLEGIARAAIGGDSIMNGRESMKTVDIVAEVSPGTLFVLQPVTPTGNVKSASAKKVLDFQALALKKLRDVRIIPQTHKLVGSF